MGTEYVKIEINELVDLLKKADELEALEAGGVDNWQWYEESLIDTNFVMSNLKSDDILVFDNLNEKN